MIEDPVAGSILTSQHGREDLGEFLRWAFERYDSDFEAICTDVLLLSEARQRDKNWTERIEDDRRARMAATLAASRIATTDPRGLGNLIMQIVGAITAEISACIGTRGANPPPIREQPISAEHRRLARNLDPGDAVISFNYDLIAPYALLNETKLNGDSFRNPGVAEVIMADRHKSKEPVFLATPHGSLLWRSYAAEGHSPSRVIVDIDGGDSRLPRDWGMMPPIILPYKVKSVVTDRMPLYRDELKIALQCLEQADEAHLLGKQFATGDTDLVDMIREACSSNRRQLTIADPNTTNAAWVEHHREVFNADEVELFPTFAAYVRSLARA